MKISIQRIVAISLAIAFALLSSVVLAGVAWNFFFPAPSYDSRSQTRSERSRVNVERTRPQQVPGSSKARGEFPDQGPRMVAKRPDGERATLPMVESDYSIDIRGDLATVTLDQTFENPGEVPLNALYELPMAEDAAVFEMTMRIGDRRIRGEVQKKQEARETYEAAKSEGKAAALLEQQRANLFSQRIANVMPDQPVEVTIKYVENVDKIDGRYQMVVPLVVGPRYEPSDMSGNELVDSEEDTLNDEAADNADGDSVQLPPVADLHAPDTIDPDRVGLEARIDGGVPVTDVASSSHAVTTTTLDPRNRQVELTKGRTIGNEHFVLSYSLEGESSQAGLLTHWNEELGRGYFSLLVEPPSEPEADEITDREMVFLLDVSGSMNGAPMEASKIYMRETLNNLRPDDTFRIIRFAHDTGSLSHKPLRATEENVQRALSYVDGLEGDGGTELVPGLEKALGPEAPEGRVRIATVLSDGYVGNEYEVVRTVRREIGDTRLAVLGIGSGTNRFALEEMAEIGRGFTHHIDPSQRPDRREAIQEAASHVADKLATPVLTDISVEWNDLSPHQTTPRPIPDLFAGESVRIMGRYNKPGDYEIEVHGNAGGEPVAIPLEVHLPDESKNGRGVELTWARSRVDDFMHQLMAPDDLRRGPLGDEGLKKRVTQIGLNHDLATKWTSFVAVSEEVVNPNPENSVDRAAAEPQAKNVPNSGYGDRPTASGTPEPTVLGSLLMALLASLGFVGRRER